MSLSNLATIALASSPAARNAQDGGIWMNGRQLSKCGFAVRTAAMLAIAAFSPNPHTRGVTNQPNFADQKMVGLIQILMSVTIKLCTKNLAHFRS